MRRSLLTNLVVAISQMFKEPPTYTTQGSWFYIQPYFKHRSANDLVIIGDKIVLRAVGPNQPLHPSEFTVCLASSVCPMYEVYAYVCLAVIGDKIVLPSFRPNQQIPNPYHGLMRLSNSMCSAFLIIVPHT
jgi:hypothetical protein